MTWKALVGIVVIHVVSGVALFLWAMNVQVLWIFWLLSVGVVVGTALSRGTTKPVYVVVIVIPVALVAFLVIRRLPVHSLNWEQLEKVELVDHTGALLKVISDQDTLREFEKFANQGYYRSVNKSAPKGFAVIIWKHGTGTTFYVCGDAWGNMPTGFAQTVFVPARKGCEKFVEGLLSAHNK